MKKAQTKNGAKVLGWNWSHSPNQIWECSAESGGFRLQATHANNELMVLDQEGHGTRVLIWVFQYKLKPRGQSGQSLNFDVSPRLNGNKIFQN